MSNIIEIYKTFEKLRVKQAREIPGRETDFFDREHTYADGFTTGRTKGSPTQFTPRGLDHYNEEKSNLTPPESFDATKPLHRYTPENSYYKPGDPSK